MQENYKASGYFPSGLPYNRLGNGPRPLVVIQGLTFENKPQSRLALQMYRFLGQEYTIFAVLRRPGLSPGTLLQDMAADYAAMIQEEFSAPIDVIGVSTGGSIAQPFAADFPNLVRRLVIHSSAYKLNEDARRLQLKVAELAQKGQWAQAYNLLFGTALPRAGLKRALLQPLLWLGARVMALGAPEDPSDLLVTVEAEDRFNFKEQLHQIAAPTLVVGGAEDPFYSPALFRETAEGIPNARLILYEGMGHPASGKQFKQEVLAFLREGRSS